MFSLRFGCIFPGQLNTVKYSPHLELSFDKTVQNHTFSCEKLKSGFDRLDKWVQKNREQSKNGKCRKKKSFSKNYNL